MDRIFEINGKPYKAHKVDFNLVCNLDDMGIAIDSLGSKQMSTIRAYFAICSGMSLEEAGIEIQEHIINDGTLDELITCFLKEVEESDFFRKLAQNSEKEDTTVQSKKAKAKK